MAQGQALNGLSSRGFSGLGFMGLGFGSTTKCFGFRLKSLCLQCCASALEVFHLDALDVRRLCSMQCKNKKATACPLQIYTLTPLQNPILTHVLMRAGVPEPFTPAVIACAAPLLRWRSCRLANHQKQKLQFVGSQMWKLSGF